MIEYNGIFQLVKVTKQDKVKSSGDTVVYFSAASKRTEKDTDFKLFKVYGHNADFMIRNLTKGNDGKYQSRKMYLRGHIETYNDNQDVACEADVTMAAIPPEYGLLKQNITIKCRTTIKVAKDILVVKYIEFVDKPKDAGLEIIINSGITNLGYSSDIKPAETKQQSDVKSVTNHANKEISTAFKELSDTDFNETNLEQTC